MANLNCTACDNLREEVPSLIVNGIDNSMCASLKNDTGLEASSGNNDCTDLNNLNDCLIGNMETEIDRYDACDWKSFTKNLTGNLWAVGKAAICAICGIWTNIHSIWTNIHSLQSRTEDICRLLDQVASPVLFAYGTLPLANTSAVIARRCGTATNKVSMMPDDGTLNPYTKAAQNIGIAYANLTAQSCTSDNRIMYEWIIPNHFYYKLLSGAQSGDVLWKVSETEAKSVIGISDYLWNVFSQSSWTWHESALSPSRQMAWMKLTVGSDGLASDEMGIVFVGCTAPNNSIASDQTFNSINSSYARLYTHTVS